MKVSGDWLTSVGTQAVFQALTAKGNRAYAVGGCVRNALMQMPVTDVDIATDATPETVTELATEAGLKAVPTGFDHGTVTLVSGGVGYEVTTFRADVETDGRHAIVRFSTDIVEDAARRDFTMNALYCDAAGNVIDPHDGLPDLQARRVRFIGDAQQRLREDHLRSLRFFRFAAWYGDASDGFDPEALAAISASLEGLSGLSRERVGSEIIKLLAAPDPAPSVASMVHTGVLHAILPGASGRALAPLVHLETEFNAPPDPLRRLASFGVIDTDPLRLSKKQITRLDLYQRLISGPEGPAELGYRHGFGVARDVVLLRSVLLEVPLEPEALAAVKRGSLAKLPVKPSHLMPSFTGPALGKKLREVEARWIASDFALTKSELLG